MRTWIVIAALVGWNALASATEWHPDARLLDAVCQIESGGGRYLYGDDGVSLGHFQMQRGAWTDVSAWRSKRGSKTFSYQPHVMNPAINRAYAADYLTIIHDRLERLYHREPSVGELYAAYNMGMNNFRKCRYSLANVNKVTARKCRELEAMVKEPVVAAVR